LCGYFDTVVVGCYVEVVVELVVERGSAGEVYILYAVGEVRRI
jgi:hypothetical protein